MICNKCYAQNPESSKFCFKCGTPLSQDTQAESFTQTQADAAAAKGAGYENAAGEMNHLADEALHQYYDAPAYHNPYQPPKKKEYTWCDFCSVIGFTCSIVGLFYFWLILCPVGLVASFLGFRANNTKGLAVAGFIISFIGVVIKIGHILYTTGILPFWLTSGVL